MAFGRFGVQAAVHRPGRIETAMPNDSVTSTIALLNDLEREAQAAGFETSAGNTGDPSNLPDWMLAAICPALVIDAGDGTMLGILFHQGYINAVEFDDNSAYTGKEPPPVEATADGLASIAATARKWIAGHTRSA